MTYPEGVALWLRPPCHFLRRWPFAAALHPNMKLKIANENRGAHPFVVVQDVGGKEHQFAWDEPVGAYCCEVADQQDIDNLFAVHWTYKRVFYHVCPVIEVTVGQTAGAVPVRVFAPSRIPPYVKPELYDAYPLQDLLMLCQDCGFVPEGDLTSPEAVKRQLRRFYEGRAWAAEEIRRLRAGVSEMPSTPKAPAAPKTNGHAPVPKRAARRVREPAFG